MPERIFFRHIQKSAPCLKVWVLFCFVLEPGILSLLLRNVMCRLQICNVYVPVVNRLRVVFAFRIFWWNNNIPFGSELGSLYYSNVLCLIRKIWYVVWALQDLWCP